MLSRGWRLPSAGWRVWWVGLALTKEDP
jgi:hypothetical protein